MSEQNVIGEQTDWAAETEASLLAAFVSHTADLGWSRRALAVAARDIGLTPAEAELLLPEGPRDLAALLARHHDAAALAALAGVDPASLKIRERIRAAALARLDAAVVDEAAIRRWMGFLALPTNAALGLRLLWASADALWRWAGDTAADENHYTKRLRLAEILLSTLALRLSAGQAAAEAHLDGRIAAVMAFERLKARFQPAAAAHRLAGALGRLRYGAARI
jgi:ubiquinone biosynthesis protein COQ9